MKITVIGSRDTPKIILKTSVKMCMYFLKNTHTLRSGAAGGMDKTVEIGYRNNKSNKIEQNAPEIFIPWSTFNNDSRVRGINYLDTGTDKKAEEIAKNIHPAWNRCTQGARKLHTRNVHQILGKDCNTPSDLVMYWCNETSDGKPTGGTATAVNLATKNNIKVINMKWDNWRYLLEKHLTAMS